VLVVIVHVTKGSVILDNEIVKVPIIIVLGGTDANVDAIKYPISFRRRVSRASAIVGFNQSLFDAPPIDAFPPHVPHYIIPQGCQLSTDPFEISPSLSSLLGGASSRDEDTSGIAPGSIHPTFRHINGDEPYFLLVAGIRPIKDVLYLCDAMMNLRSSLKQQQKEEDQVQVLLLPTLVIIGPILDKVYHETVLEAVLKSEGGVKLFPAVSQLEINKMARSSLAILNTSLSEGQSSALLEAMTWGVPVMARNITGNRKLLSSVYDSFMSTTTTTEEISSCSSPLSCNKDDLLITASQQHSHEDSVTCNTSNRDNGSQDIIAPVNVVPTTNGATILLPTGSGGVCSGDDVATADGNEDEDDGDVGGKEWRLYHTGVLFSSPEGFVEAARRLFFTTPG